MLTGFQTQPRFRIDRRELVECFDIRILLRRQPLHFLNLSHAWALLTTTELNEPLCGNFLTDGEEAIAAITESNGSAIEVPDEDLLKAAALIAQEEGLDILPASAGAVWGISKLDSKNHLFVAVLTGRGHPGSVR